MDTKITYTVQGDYNLPDLKLPEQEERKIGIWGQRRRRYLKQHRPILYTNLLTSCKLSEHLAAVEEECTQRMDSLVKA
ncbi:MAG: TnpV protein, partial [Ruminococcus sp.]|nr:TnpV protein [Ruminococcus sp.]